MRGGLLPYLPARPLGNKGLSLRAHVRGGLLPYLPARPLGNRGLSQCTSRVEKSCSNLRDVYFLTLDNAPVPENKKANVFISVFSCTRKKRHMTKVMHMCFFLCMPLRECAVCIKSMMQSGVCSSHANSEGACKDAIDFSARGR